jgi:cell wall assembly regulator SMI1
MGLKRRTDSELPNRFRDTLERVSPGLGAHLGDGASEEAIAQLEETLGVSLPDDVRAFYREINGQEPDAPNLVDGTELLSLARIADEWAVWNGLLRDGSFEDARSAPAAGVKDDWWNPAWIPLTYNGAGDHYSLDLDPAPAGTRGQIIMMWHDDAERTRHAASFTDWIEGLCDAMERGDYVYSHDEYFAIVRREDVE